MNEVYCNAPSESLTFLDLFQKIASSNLATFKFSFSISFIALLYFFSFDKYLSRLRNEATR